MTVHDVAGFEPVRDNVEMTLSESQKDSLYPLYGEEGLQGPCGAVARSQIVRRAWTALYERRVAGRPTSARESMSPEVFLQIGEDFLLRFVVHTSGFLAVQTCHELLGPLEMVHHRV